MSPPRLVLVRPRNPDNLAAIARVMPLFGLAEWVAVSEARFIDGMLDVLERHRRAPEGGVSLSSLRRVDSLPEALEGCAWSVGTTMRYVGFKPRFTPRGLAEEVARRGDERWALVLGAESNGLTNDDLRHCAALSYIPSDDAQPSLNLAQAMVVYAHELSSRPSLPELEEVAGSPDAKALVSTLRRAGLDETEVKRWTAVLASLQSP